MGWQELIAPGDVLVCHGTSWFAKLIEAGAVIRGLPSFSHIAVAHHRDAAGTLWAVEGRPGGVGWADCARYLGSPYTIANPGQPKTAAQRGTVCLTLVQLLKTPYDWDAIMQDAAQTLNLPALWQEKWNGQVPGHVVCSSLAAWAYKQAALTAPAPADPRHVQPADWAAEITQHHWASLAAEEEGRGR